VDLKADISILKKHTVYIFTAKNCEDKTVCLSETSVSAHKSTRCYNPEDQHQHLHCSESLKPDKNICFNLLYAAIFSDPTKVIQLDKYFSNLALETTYLRRNENASNVAETIRKFYFGDSHIDNEAVNKVTNVSITGEQM
jgi:hypothetical protein